MVPIIPAISVKVPIVPAGLKLCLVTFLLLLFSCTGGGDGNFTVKDGFFQQTIVEKGELEALNVVSIFPPRMTYTSQLKIIWLAEHGTMVHKGDTVVQFDPSATEKTLVSQQGLVDNVLMTQRKEDIAAEIADKETEAQWQSEQDSYELSKLQMERAKFETGNLKKIKELQFQRAAIQKDKVERKLLLQPILRKYNRAISSDITLRQRSDNVLKVQQELDKLVLIAPSDGLLQIAERPSSGGLPYKEGDIANSPYYPVATIPNVSQMKVSTSIREVDFAKVKTGMKVLVRLDALPSVSFKGVVTFISKICLADRDGKKSFKVEVLVQEKDDRLKPGMTVNCEYIFYESEKDLFVPNNCLLRTDTADYVFVQKSGSPRRVSVRVGPSNNHYTVIQSDLKVGQQLVPFEEVLNKKNE